MKTICYFAFVIAISLSSTKLKAHDTWLECDAATVPVGEYTYVHLMLGNHGNDHRDFKLASKVSLTPCTLAVLTPDGRAVDLKSRMIDRGSAEREGFWSAQYTFVNPGLHRFIHTLDTLHRTTRAIKSAKTFVMAMRPGRPSAIPSRKDACHGFGLELVLKTPFERIAAGEHLELQVMRSGKPLESARVTFVPRGTTLNEGFDANHERMTDSDGLVRLTPDRGNVFLAVVHHLADDESGDGYEKTHYSAAMVLQVPHKSIRSR